MSTTTTRTIEIRHRYTDTVLHTGEYETMRAAVLDAVASGADLSDAILRDADLSGADLSGAILRDADLSGADLSGADLSDAILRDADLSGADLSGAILRDADLSGAILRDADLRPIRDDLYEGLAAAPAEVPALLTALREGRIDGTVYEGECACLVGTIAKARGCSYAAIEGLRPNSSRPSERWFLAITPGKKPENDPVAKITAEWIESWLAEHAPAGTQGGGDE